VDAFIGEGWFYWCFLEFSNLVVEFKRVVFFPNSPDSSGIRVEALAA